MSVKWNYFSSTFKLSDNNEMYLISCSDIGFFIEKYGRLNFKRGERGPRLNVRDFPRGNFTDAIRTSLGHPVLLHDAHSRIGIAIWRNSNDFHLHNRSMASST